MFKNAPNSSGGGGHVGGQCWLVERSSIHQSCWSTCLRIYFLYTNCEKRSNGREATTIIFNKICRKVTVGPAAVQFPCMSSASFEFSRTLRFGRYANHTILSPAGTLMEEGLFNTLFSPQRRKITFTDSSQVQARAGATTIEYSSRTIFHMFCCLFLNRGWWFLLLWERFVGILIRSDCQYITIGWEKMGFLADLDGKVNGFMRWQWHVPQNASEQTNDLIVNCWNTVVNGILNP